MEKTNVMRILDQKKIKNRLILTVPLFAAVIGISIWDFLSPQNFNILWRWFAWSNQVLAAICLWVSTGYLVKTSRNKYLSLFTSIPALFMTMVVITYVFTDEQFLIGKYLPYLYGILIGAVISLGLFIFYLVRMIIRKEPPMEDKPNESQKAEVDAL